KKMKDGLCLKTIEPDNNEKSETIEKIDQTIKIDIQKLGKYKVQLALCNGDNKNSIDSIEFTVHEQ
ncbi:MAG: hypothetical protein MHPSP_003387, partial [Paramarteilia canceri]